MILSRFREGAVPCPSPSATRRRFQDDRPRRRRVVTLSLVAGCIHISLVRMAGAKSAGQRAVSRMAVKRSSARPPTARARQIDRRWGGDDHQVGFLPQTNVPPETVENAGPRGAPAQRLECRGADETQNRSVVATRLRGRPAELPDNRAGLDAARLPATPTSPLTVHQRARRQPVPIARGCR